MKMQFRFRDIIYLCPTFFLILGGALKVIYGSGNDHPYYHLIGTPFGIAAGYLVVIQLLVMFLIPQFRHSLRSHFETLILPKVEKQERHELFAFTALTFPIFSYLYFWLTKSHLFQGVDGDYLIAMNSNQRLFENPPYFFTSNILQGLGGNVFFPINVRLDLGFNFLYYVGSLSEVGQVGALTIWASSLFYSSWYLFNSLQLRFSTSASSAAILTFCCLFPSSTNFTSILLQMPSLATLISGLCLMLALRNKMLLSKSRNKFVVFTAILVLYLAFLYPTWLIIFIPYYGFYLLCTMKFQRSRSTFRYIQRHSVVKVASLSLIYLATSILILIYIAGFFLNSSAFIFGADMESVKWMLKQISLVFRSPLNASFVLLSLLGALIAIFIKSQIRSFVGCFLGSYLIQVIYGLLAFFGLVQNKLPFPVYFEIALYPSLSLLFVLIMQSASKILKSSLTKLDTI
jgi:hypothetical protein